MAFRFQSFPIYQEVRSFVKEIYQLTRSFPKSEQFELSSQLRRATTSILLNLAEGSAKKSDAELNRFVMISIGSLAEIVAILDVCLDQNYISENIHLEVTKRCESLARQLYGFSRRLTKQV